MTRKQRVVAGRRPRARRRELVTVEPPSDLRRELARAIEGVRLIMERIEMIEGRLDTIEKAPLLRLQSVPSLPTLGEIRGLREEFGHLQMFAARMRERLGQLQAGVGAANGEFVARPVFHGWKEAFNERVEKLEREVYEITGKPPLP